MNKTTLIMVIYNAIVVACFTALSIFFAKWWIMFFALLFISFYPVGNRKKTRICDSCYRSSESAANDEEAIKRAQRCGWIHIKEGNLDYCPDCLSKIKKFTGDNIQ